MKKILYIITIIVASFSVVSCQKPQEDHCLRSALMITIIDKDGNDLLAADNPNSIAGKISVAYRGKTFSNMQPTNIGSHPEGVSISSDTTPNRLGIADLRWCGGIIEGYNEISWEKGDEIVITMPDGTKHVFTYCGFSGNTGWELIWSFDGIVYEYRHDYTIIYEE